MATEGPMLKGARRFSGWLIAAAILFIVLGVFAIIEPAVAGLGVALLVGWLLIFGGVSHLISAFEGGGTRRVLFQILAAVVFLVGGYYLLRHPLLALGTLTLLLAAVILVAGVCEIITYFRLRSERATGWMLANGILALVLGGMIWLQWPSSSVWAIGTLVGVNLLFTGITRLMVGLTGRRLIRHATA
ncbi:MAG TPA: DUF308 domain-containing protein [Steroidobacteraceae bacterium]|nr:DUF308 domain-containing protein [Steroidobacteraceae bacterium]